MYPSIEASPKYPSIKRLPEDVINQIAAGEVIERPSSILKELIENSLDAGATQINVYLKNGGIDEVCVVDDGRGIELEELDLAVERHATSKLRKSEDLFSLNTLGFRGEALSSICSVADVEIQSRTFSAEAAYSVLFKFGRPVRSPKYLGAPLGTRVTVTHLFETTPARKKFLRTFQTELAHCQHTLKEIALGHPEVRFTLHHNQKLLVSYTSQTKRDRFLECLKLKTDILEIHNSHEHLRFQAFFVSSQSQIARAELYLFINGRPVRNRSLLSTIRNVYREMNPNIQEPVGACYLDMRKDWVDVNVHPQKWEVRCLEQASIYHWIISTLKKSFSSPPSPTLPPVSFASTPSKIPPLTPSSYSFGGSQPPQTTLQWVGRTSQALICADERGIVIADIKKLSCQLQADRLLEQWNQKEWPSIRLPLPSILHFSESQAELFEKYRDFFKNWGFHLEHFGERDYSLQSRPSFLSDATASSVLPQLLAQFSDPDLAKNFLSNPSKLLLFFVSTAQELSNEFLPCSPSELISKLEKLRKEPSSKAHLYLEVSYEQLHHQGEQ